MENDQLINKVEWLDEERRGDKHAISELLKRIAKLEGALERSDELIKGMDSEITRLTVVIAKVDEFNVLVETHKVEIKKEIDTGESRRKRREAEAKKKQQSDNDFLNRKIEEIQEKVAEIPTLQNENTAGIEEDTRLHRLIGEVSENLVEVRKTNQDRVLAVSSLEENQRQSLTRVTDMQGEIAAIRKRADEARAQVEIVLDGQRKNNTRLENLISSEAEHRETQAEFIEKLLNEQDERQKQWKEWSKGFDTITEQSQALAVQMQNIADSERAVRDAQTTFEEITAQINRRINEITEIQRLGDERFRQEWATFKADDQKRWTNYTLTQDEIHSEGTRRTERLGEQVTSLEDVLQELQDIVQNLSEQSEKRLRKLLESLREWVAEDERFTDSLQG